MFVTEIYLWLCSLLLIFISPISNIRYMIYMIRVIHVVTRKKLLVWKKKRRRRRTNKQRRYLQCILPPHAGHTFYIFLSFCQITGLTNPGIFEANQVKNGVCFFTLKFSILHAWNSQQWFFGFRWWKIDLEFLFFKIVLKNYSSHLYFLEVPVGQSTLNCLVFNISYITLIQMC